MRQTRYEKRLRQAQEHVAAHDSSLRPKPIHPHHVLKAKRDSESGIEAFNGWLADHIVALVGTMGCAYLFAIIALISLPSALSSGNVIVIVAWVAQTFIQLVLLSVILVAQNRQEERDHLKAETDHRNSNHLYEVNDEQIKILRRLDRRR